MPTTGPTIACPSPVMTSLDGKAMAATADADGHRRSDTGVDDVLALRGHLPGCTTPLTCTAVDGAQRSLVHVGRRGEGVYDYTDYAAAADTVTFAPVTLTAHHELPDDCACDGDEDRERRANTAGELRRPTVSGAVAPVEIRCSPTSGSQFQVGNTTVTCEATDAKGNTGSCTTTVTVKKPTAAAILRGESDEHSVASAELRELRRRRDRGYGTRHP